MGVVNDGNDEFPPCVEVARFGDVLNPKLSSYGITKLMSGDFKGFSTLRLSFLSNGVVLCRARYDGVGNFQ